MAKLTKAEIAAHHAWLSDWHSPDEVAHYVSAVNDAMGSVDFFAQGGTQFLRDAWLAAKFGGHLSVEQVRLVPTPDRWPDFEARSGNSIERVECVEADLPGRRRGDEYRNAARRVAAGKPNIEQDPIEDWYARAEQIPAALSKVIEGKVAKNYVGRASLLVHLNIGEWGVGQERVESDLPKTVAIALPHFVRVWVCGKRVSMVLGKPKTVTDDAITSRGLA